MKSDEEYREEAAQIKQALLKTFVDEINSLPELCRIVYLKIFLEEKNCFQIAHDLDITVDSARVQAAKAKSLLKSNFLKEVIK